MIEIVIRLDDFMTRYSFHGWLKEQCNFPSYYGHNLDALYDCLRDNPNFIFKFIPSITHHDFEKKVIKTMKEAGCQVEIIQE